VPVYATKTHGYCYAPLDFLGTTKNSVSKRPACARPGDKFIGLDLSAHLLPKYRRQLCAWKAHGATIHLIVYDLLPLDRPDWFNSAACGHFRDWFEVVIAEADQAICISDQVAREVRERAGPTLSIGRLHMGADIAASLPSTGVSPEVASLVDRLDSRPAILMVGTVEPRKGYEVALAAFDHLWQEEPAAAPDLVIVGKAGWKAEAVQDRIRSHPQNGKRLHWLTDVSDEGLCKLYEASRGLFMASRAEGFGLPIIEAAMHRRHILARDLPVFREQKVENILYFVDDRPQVLGRRLMDLARAGQDRAAPAIALPTWRDSVDGLLSEIGLAAVEQRHPEPLLLEAS
jgi:glycosyltransferase involved in cell wall biosynthesis